LHLADVKNDQDTAVSASPALNDSSRSLLQTWSESSRYEKGKTVEAASDRLEAIEDPKGGILPWVRQRW
jgi:hypothetical protein